MTINNVTLTGRLGGDPEIRSLQDGTSVANFSLAVNVYERGENNTMWVKCTVFGNKADVAEKYLNKGAMITVNGRLREENYVNKNGDNVTNIGIIVYDFTLPPQLKEENNSF